MHKGKPQKTWANWPFWFKRPLLYRLSYQPTVTCNPYQARTQDRPRKHSGLLYRLSYQLTMAATETIGVSCRSEPGSKQGGKCQPN